MPSDPLSHAARICGIALTYKAHDGELRRAPPATVQKLLAALDVEKNPETLPIRRRRAAIDQSFPSFIICWNGIFPKIWIWLRTPPVVFSMTLTNEDGQSTIMTCPVSDIIQRKIGNEIFYRCLIRIEEHLELGLYDLTMSGPDGKKYSCPLISAPKKIKPSRKKWGAFAPIYALHSTSSQGSGGFKELNMMAEFISKNGGGFVGSLPLLPLFHERNENSPYSPITRLFLNEIYLDVTDLPGFNANDNLIDWPHAEKHINFQSLLERKQKIILEAANAFFRDKPEGDTGFQKYLKTVPFLKEYAIFRSRQTSLPEHYYLYTQYACHLQMAEIETGQIKLYLDYPVGVHPEGFDAHKFAHLFMKDFSVGAPPDAFNPQGQNWGFRPFDPQAMIKDRFKYMQETLRFCFRYAHMLRLDHVMGLYRIYCIPQDCDGTQGAYIYYPFQALLALLCLETARHEAILIGENLGTVPEAVNKAMIDHHILRMWISRFEMAEDPQESFQTIEADMMASMNTHDMFPFEAFMTGSDIRELANRNLIDKETMETMLKDRTEFLTKWNQEKDPFMTCLKGISASKAETVIVNMEDLWKEVLPQNIPGTESKDFNWNKKHSLPIEEWASNQNIKTALHILNQDRGVH